MHPPVSEGTPDDPGPRTLATDSGGEALERPYLLKTIALVVALVALLGVAACSGASLPGVGTEVRGAVGRESRNKRMLGTKKGTTSGRQRTTGQEAPPAGDDGREDDGQDDRDDDSETMPGGDDGRDDDQDDDRGGDQGDDPRDDDGRGRPKTIRVAMTEAMTEATTVGTTTVGMMMVGMMMVGDDDRNGTDDRDDQGDDDRGGDDGDDD